LIKDRSGIDLTEAEDIKKRWQEYTEELFKKIFMTQIISHRSKSAAKGSGRCQRNRRGAGSQMDIEFMSSVILD